MGIAFRRGRGVGLSWVAGAAGFVLLAGAPIAHAALIEYTFDGSIDADYLDPDAILPGGLTLGSTFSYRMVVDTDTPAGPFPSGYPTPDGVFYPGAITDYALTLSSGVIGPAELPLGPDDGIQVQNDYLMADGMAAVVGDLSNTSIVVSLIAPDTLYNSTDLPTSIDINDYDTAAFSYRVVGDGYDFFDPHAGALGYITSITMRTIPAPGAAAMLISVAPLATPRRRRTA